jgi:hypothetical protein
VFGEPLALESRPSVDLVVELESERRLERLDALLQLISYVHDAFEQFAVGDVGEVADTKVGSDADVQLAVLRQLAGLR